MSNSRSEVPIIHLLGKPNSCPLQGLYAFCRAKDRYPKKKTVLVVSKVALLSE